MYEQIRDVQEIARCSSAPPPVGEDRGPAGVADRRPVRHQHHVRHSALPKPGQVRELLELCARLHSTRLAWKHPLWEVHVIEGMRDGRVATYTKIHHALVDGISANRLLQSAHTTDPDKRGMPAPWGARLGAAKVRKEVDKAEKSWRGCRSRPSAAPTGSPRRRPGSPPRS